MRRTILVLGAVMAVLMFAMVGPASERGLSPHPATAAEVCKPTNPGSVLTMCLDKTASPDPAPVGETLTFTVTVSLQGPGGTATTGFITDSLPAGVTFVSATSEQGSCVYDEVSHAVTCGPFGLSGEDPALNDVTYTITVIPNSPGTITNTVSGPVGLITSATVQVTEPPTPQTKADCKNGGYEKFGFKNQGQCIKAVNAAN
jgi:uncharacterized repeat protein (TIGR01451 family)